jgi:peptide chain release factor 3
MQFEVAAHRLEREFGTQVAFEPAAYRVARRTDADGERIVTAARGADVLHRTDGTPMAVFTSEFHLEQFRRDHPDVALDRLMAG